MFVFTTSRLGRTSGMLPTWFAVVGAFLLLRPSFRRALVLVFPLWLLALCGLLAARARRDPLAGA